MAFEKWLRPKEIYEMTGIKPDLIKYHRRKGHIAYKRSPGSNKKGGRTFYNLKEVLRVIGSGSFR